MPERWRCFDVVEFCHLLVGEAVRIGWFWWDGILRVILWGSDLVRGLIRIIEPLGRSNAPHRYFRNWLVAFSSKSPIRSSEVIFHRGGPMLHSGLSPSTGGCHSEGYRALYRN